MNNIKGKLINTFFLVHIQFNFKIWTSIFEKFKQCSEVCLNTLYFLQITVKLIKGHLFKPNHYSTSLTVFLLLRLTVTDVRLTSIVTDLTGRQCDGGHTKILDCSTFSRVGSPKVYWAKEEDVHCYRYNFQVMIVLVK